MTGPMPCRYSPRVRAPPPAGLAKFRRALLALEEPHGLALLRMPSALSARACAALRRAVDVQGACSVDTVLTQRLDPWTSCESARVWTTLCGLPCFVTHVWTGGRAAEP